MVRISSVLLLTVLVPGLLACSPAGSGPTRPEQLEPETVLVYPQPADGWTSYHGRLTLAVELAIPGGGRSADDIDPTAIAERLAPELSLVAWPSREPVPAIVRALLPSLLGDDFETDLVLEITPSDALAEEGWYAIRLASLPIVPPPGMPSDLPLEVLEDDWMEIPGGERFARFTRASEPRVAALTVCEDEASQTTNLRPSFSEPIVTTGKVQDAFSVRKDGIAWSCAADYTIAPDDVVGEVSLDCPGMPGGATVEVALLAERLFSRSGVVVPPSALHFVMSDLAHDGDGCGRVLAPPDR